MVHRNARLTAHGRRLLVERVGSGRPVAHVAAAMASCASRREGQGQGHVTRTAPGLTAKRCTQPPRRPRAAGRVRWRSGRLPDSSCRGRRDPSA
ncbi:hypothetical protein ABZ914_16235 [Spirillospora sp. NPDC046719]